MKKEITIEEVKYEYGPITEGQFEEMIVEMKESPFDQIYLVACCLNNADKGGRSAEEIKQIDRPTFMQLLNLCLEVNGLTKN